MKRLLLSIAIFIFININANSQIEQGNWMVGGSGNYSVQNENINNQQVRSTSIALSPKAGYFFLNKFCSGINLDYTFNKIRNLTYNYSQTTLNYYYVAPFIRYYFLKSDKVYNLLGEISYGFLLNKIAGGENNNGLTFTTGIVAFLNSTVGIELTCNYQFLDRANNTNTKTFFIGVGFQIHLETEKNYNKHH